MGSLNPLDHIPYLPTTWKDIVEGARKTANSVNSLINGNPVPERWDDYTSPMSAGKVAGANVPGWAVFRDGLYAYAFDDNKSEEIFVSIHISHTWKPGTNLYPHIHWSPGSSTASGTTVRWCIEYSIAKGYGAGVFPSTTTIALESTTDGTAYNHYIVEATDGQAFDGVEVDSILMMRIYRDGTHANDTFSGDAFGLFVDVHFQEDRMIGTPYRNPDFYEPVGA